MIFISPPSDEGGGICEANGGGREQCKALKHNGFSKCNRLSLSHFVTAPSSEGASANNINFYLISCSRLLNSGVSKNSASVIPKQSQMILIVKSLGFLLLPYKIAFTEDGGKAQIVASLFMVILRSPHSC